MNAPTTDFFNNGTAAAAVHHHSSYPSFYTTGLFDVTIDRAITIDTLLCYCCQVGRQFSAIEGYPNTHNWLMTGIACGFAEFVPCCLRCKVSDMYGLNEPIHHSCAKGFFCGPCSVCQTGRELRARGLNPGGTCVPKRMGGGGSDHEDDAVDASGGVHTSAYGGGYDDDDADYYSGAAVGDGDYSYAVGSGATSVSRRRE